MGSVGTALTSFALLAVVWRGLLMKGFYRQHLSHLARMADGAMNPVAGGLI